MPINVFGGGPVNTAYVGYASYNLQTNTALFWPSSYQDTKDNAAAFIQVTDVINPAIELTLPAADQVSVGQELIISNTSLNNFELLDNGGHSLGTINVGTSYYYILTDNSTASGVWLRVTFGAGVANIDAVELAGLGLQAVNGKLNTGIKVITTSLPTYNVTSNNNATLVVWTGGAGNVILPPINSLDDGFYFSLNNEGGGEILISGDGLIDNQTTFAVGISQSLTLVKNANKWWTIGFGQQTFFALSVLNKDVSGNTNITLSQSESLKNIQQYYGLLTGNINVYFPVSANEWTIYNNTTGAFTLSVSLAGPTGSTYTVPQGATQIFYSDGLTLRPTPSTISLTNVSFPSGTATSPGITFINDTTTGIWQSSNGHLNLTAAGSGGLELTNDSLAISKNTTVFGDLTANHVNPIIPIDIIHGGTGQNNRSSAITALMAPSSSGGTTYFDGSNWVNLAIGIEDSVLRVVGGLPIWSDDLVLDNLDVNYINLASSGTVTTPVISFAGSFNTGIWRSAANHFNIAASGTDIVDISSTLVSLKTNTTVTGTLSATTINTTNPLAVIYGGTGAATQQAALKNLMPTLPALAALGTTVYYNGTDWVNLAVGANNQILNVSTNTPAWTSTPTLSSLTLSTPLAISSGGTGASTQPAALNNLMPATPATGTTVYYDGTNWVKLAAGPDNSILNVSSATHVPAWTSTPTLSSLTLSTPLAISSGGTGSSTRSTALSALMPATPATGTTVYYNGTDWVNLAVGTNNQILNVSTNTPAWTSTPTLSSLTLSTPLAISSGGTGASTQPAALNNLMPATPATGTTVYYNGTNWVNLAVGTNGRCLTLSGGLPSWNGYAITQFLQVLNSTSSTMATRTTFNIVTGLSLSITLINSTATTMIECTMNSAAAGNNAYLALYRDNTQLAIFGASYVNGFGNAQVVSSSISYTDTPGGVGPYVYSIKAASSTGTGTLYINRDSNNVLNGLTSAIRVREIS